MPENWPAVNQVVLRASVSEKPERNVRSFQPEFGPPMEGRRTSVSTDVFAFTGRVTSNEWDTLMAWYRDTLKDGSLTFTRNHPRTAAAGDCA
jgi:hypothetical protein